MADNEDFENEQDDEGSESRTPNPQREYQRRIEKENRKLQADLEAERSRAAKGSEAERELAFIKAGVDMSKGAAKLLLKTYDGELSESAIRAVAEEYDLVPTSQKEEVKEEIKGLQEVSKVSSTSSGTVAPSVFDKIKEAGRTNNPEEVLKLARELGVPISMETPGEVVSLV